jgi:hypothetical protein
MKKAKEAPAGNHEDSGTEVEVTEASAPENVLSVLEELVALKDKIEAMAVRVEEEVNPTNVFGTKYRRVLMTIVELETLSIERGHEGIPKKEEIESA